MDSQWWQNFSAIATFVGAVIVGAGTLGQHMFGKEVEKAAQAKEQAATLERNAALATQAAADAELRRRSILLGQIRQQYLLSHDGISSAMMAGTEDLPKAWVDKELARQGEVWRQERYR